jgi:hypothetical protein
VAFGRAVAVWQHLRAMIARGEGQAVALLWTAWALATEVDDPARDARARAEAVALGATPRAASGLEAPGEGARARARRRGAAHGGHRSGCGGRGDHAQGGDTQHSHRVDARARGALAAAWAEELLRMLWASARVRRELAEGVSLGREEAAQRTAWEAVVGATSGQAISR